MKKIKTDYYDQDTYLVDPVMSNVNSMNKIPLGPDEFGIPPSKIKFEEPDLLLSRNPSEPNGLNGLGNVGIDFMSIISLSFITNLGPKPYEAPLGFRDDFLLEKRDSNDGLQNHGLFLNDHLASPSPLHKYKVDDD
jgi:hypothetical protein